MAITISRAFKDISLSFKKHPVTNDVIALKNEDAIKKSVINLCRTRLNERFFNDLLGTSIEDSLFELADGEIGSSIEEEIKTLLNNFEPRIALTNVFVDDQLDNNALYVTIKYDIVGLPIPPQNIEFLLQPSRV
jgi:phage baseplate assembly protein W|tara:strand:+ start:616 stop:1017 length:402 start_codon:yes stop_codon:yes gene_type:complete